MHFNFSNVNDAFVILVRRFSESGKQDPLFSTRESRVGSVVEITEPVIITYEHPTIRTLLFKQRDANPFFHVYEAMWMLAGRNDLASLKQFVSTFDNFSDDGVTLNGAYGYRWRHAILNNNSPFEEERDQLEILIEHLKSNPNSRRAVLQMWNVEDDLLKVDSSKDVCCNLSVVFSIRKESQSEGDIAENGEDPGSLDMTVFNRSNDLIWGCLGANYVHFTFLQEYMASKLGVNVGRYHQVTTNLHVYTERFQPEKWLSNDSLFNMPNLHAKNKQAVPLISEPAYFDSELHDFVNTRLKDWRPEHLSGYKNLFFRDVAIPMLLTLQGHKEKNIAVAKHWARLIKDDMWRTAVQDWLDLRWCK
jgi:thymidylate synthase